MTVRTILLLRHAKSDWDASFDHDHNRPLAERGRKAAARMGRLIAESGNTPDFVYSSTAVRARDTVGRAAEAGGWSEVPVKLEERLYGGTWMEILSLARGLPKDVRTVLFAGHEPGWSQAVSVFSGGGHIRMTTACLARLDFHADRWGDCREGGAVLVSLIAPKALG